MGELAGRSYSPRAIVDFLVASQRRADAVARRRPELVRQAGGWLVVGLAPWAIVGHRRGLRCAAGGVCWWTACGAMVYWHLGMFETPDGRPRRLGGADALTLARAWLVPIAWDRPTPAVCALAGLTDAFDGALARRGEPTRAGRDLEGLVDSCMGIAALRGCARHDLLAPAAVTVETVRLAVGAVYSAASYFGLRRPPERSVLTAGRSLSPLRVVSLVAAAGGRRTLASVLVGAGALAAIVDALSAAGVWIAGGKLAGAGFSRNDSGS